jgi:hypothetical protein
MTDKIDCKLTRAQKAIIEIIEAEHIEFGQVTFKVYYQHGKIIRVEREKVLESKMIKS